MSAQREHSLKEQGRRLLRWLAVAFGLLAHGARAAWWVLRPSLIFALNVLLALLLLFEEWGWRPLSSLLAQLARFRIWALAELWIAGLPPYGALTALAVPSMIVIPTKLIGVYLLATGHILTATALILCAKIVGTALVARIFILTKPQLMQIAWFQRTLDTFVPWQEALFTKVRATWAWRTGHVAKRRANTYVRRSWTLLRPQLEAAWARLKPRLAAQADRRRAGTRVFLAQGAEAGRRLVRRLEALTDLRRH